MNPTVLRKNFPTKRILVTSDIHGQAELFDRLLEKMRYNPEEDALVVIGDLAQRGDDSFGVVHRCMQLAKNENVVILQGNNDAFVVGDNYPRLLKWIHFFNDDPNGSTFHSEAAQKLGLPLPETEAEVQALSQKLNEAFPEEMDFLRSRPHVLETDKFLFAHAGLQHEDLEHNSLEYVLQCEYFHREVQHRFEKLLLVGHYPVANYLPGNRLSHVPLYNEQYNTLSIDGGITIKQHGQLNGVILDNETGSWSWTCVDPWPVISAPCSQQAQPGYSIVWPDHEVKVLERGETLSRCRIHTGDEVEIPTEYLSEEDGKFYTRDYATARLSVTAGEPLSLIWQGDDRMLVKKNGEVGLLFL